MTLSPRPATQDDIDKVLALDQAAAGRASHWTREAYLEELNKPFSRFLVLTDEGSDTQIAGFIVFWLQFNECHVLNVAVALEWRGLGLGRRLMRLAINEAHQRNATRVFLEVRKSNSPAISMYQTLGFFTDHIKPRFYSDGEDACFMALFLNKSKDL